MTEYPKTILFYRDLVAYTGGHQKVADYFQHIQSSTKYHADISFSSRTWWDAQNPWFPDYQYKAVDYLPNNYDYLFLAGMDWAAHLPQIQQCSKPVINLIQHVRHADSREDVHQFLTHPAIRICVSPEVEAAITATGLVNGPVLTISNGVALPDLALTPKIYDLLILGVKKPELAKRISQALSMESLNICVVNSHIPRAELHNKMAQSRIALLLPNDTEGFYLPALEAMHFCDIAIVPDCIGNRSFCRHQKNCLMPAYNESSLLHAIKLAQTYLADPLVIDNFQAEAAATLAAHSLANERTRFLAVMDDIDQLWFGRE